MNHLRNFKSELKLISSKMSMMVSKYAESGDVLLIDKLFGQMSIDVICKIAFQYDLRALDESARFLVSLL